MAVSSARGMRDFLPRDKEHRDQVLGSIETTYHRHGFESIETPAMEDFDTLHSGLGGDNEKLSFHVHKRGLSTEDIQAASSPDDLSDLGLRFDLTVPLARFYRHPTTAPCRPFFALFTRGPCGGQNGRKKADIASSFRPILTHWASQARSPK